MKDDVTTETVRAIEAIVLVALKTSMITTMLLFTS